MGGLRRPRVALLILLAAVATSHAAAQECNQTFWDAIGGGDTWLMRQGLDLAGYGADKLPSPDIGVTLLVPNNEAWLHFMWKNGLFLRQLSDLGDKLTSVITFHIMPTGLSPDTLRAAEGRHQTMYGLLTLQDAPLKTWPYDPKEQILFQGPWDDTVSGTTKMIQVCNSWVYIVDRVLKPAYDLSDVLDVEIPDLSSLGGSAPSSPAPSSPAPSSPAPSSPAPSSPAPAPAAPTVAKCDKSFAQLAGETSGLSVLQLVLSQKSYAASLPDPSENYTFFAPTDNAFFGLLSLFNLTVPDALKLGDKLNSVLLYHIGVGALTPDQLAQQTSLSTGLALKTGDSSYSIGVSAADGQSVTVTDVYGQSASLGTNLAICGSQVYVIDKVLVPAKTLEEIPSVADGLEQVAAAAATAPASPAQAPAAGQPATAGPSPAAATPAQQPAQSPAAVPSSPAQAPAAGQPPAATPTQQPAQSPTVAAQSPAAVPSSPAQAPAAGQPPAAAPSTPAAAPMQQPAAAPSPAAAALGQVVLSGVALGTGYLANCAVELTVPGGTSQSTVTDVQGRFSIVCGADCATPGATLTLAPGGQGCADSLTQLPPPFAVLGPADPSLLPEGVNLTALSPLTTIIAAASKPTQPAAAPPPAPATTGSRKLLGRAALAEAARAEAQAEVSLAQQLLPQLGSDFAITEGSSPSVGTSYGDALEAALDGDMAAYDLLSKNQELMCTGSISGALLSSLVGGFSTTPSAAAEALFDQLAADLLAGSPFNLTDTSSVQQLLARALAQLTSAASDAAPPSVDTNAVLQAASEKITLINSFLQQAVLTAQADQMAAGADKMVQVLARLAKVCQVDVAPAAVQLASGQLSVDGWNEQFSQQAIADLAIAATLE